MRKTTLSYNVTVQTQRAQGGSLLRLGQVVVDGDRQVVEHRAVRVTLLRREDEATLEQLEAVMQRDLKRSVVVGLLAELLDISLRVNMH